MKTTILTLTFLLSVLSGAFGQETARYPHNKPISRNVIALFPTKATKVNGLCIALSHNKPRTINGLNIEFPGARFTEYFVYRLSREIYPERFSTVNGVTITFNPIYKEVNGLGIFLFVPEIYTFNGLAIGAFNAVKEMHGVQIGFFNDGYDGRFIQLGLINTIYSNPLIFRTLPFINLRFRKKSESREE